MNNTEKLLNKHPELAIDRNQYNINVTSNSGDKVDKKELLELYQNFKHGNKPSHLYFHLPLCNYICHFCNYVKKKVSSGEEKDKQLEHWTNLLIEESTRSLLIAPWTSTTKIESIYFGGGTAALLKKEHLEKIIKHIRENYQLSGDVEISLEGNPDNFTDDAIRDAIQLGFNRFSIGVQSLQDEVTKFTGRGHDSEMSIRAIKRLIESGLPFNVDIMFGLPYQTTKSVKNDIEMLLDMGVPTITIYRLRNADRQSMGIGNKSAWNQQRISEKLEQSGLFPDLQETYKMRDVIVEAFKSRNYKPSPCGWWSAPGVYPNGNIPRVSKSKWENFDNMIGFGPGAYGWLSDENGNVIQTHHITDINGFEKDLGSNAHEIPFSYGRILTGNQAIATVLGFNFKSNQPIQIDKYKKRFGVDILHDGSFKKVIGLMISKGFLEYDPGNNSLLPTVDGEALHEEIISVYIHGMIGSLQEVVCHKTNVQNQELV